MIWHPVTLAIGLLESLTAVFYLAAAGRLVVLLPAWNPASRDRPQLDRERRLELIRHMGRWILGLQVTSLFLFVAAVSNLWPSLVPGAMCGSGVVQAMAGAGDQTFFLRLALLGLLFGWHVLAGIEQQHPLHQAVVPAGRLLLLAGPVFAASVWTLATALLSVQPDQPVSCCATVYAQAATAAPALDFAWHSVNWAMLAGFGAGIALLHGAGLCWRPEKYRLLHHSLALLTIAWLPAAVMAIRFAAAPYLLEVLFHPCPWCLLRGGQGALGVALFGTLAWIGSETIAGLVGGSAARRYPQLQPLARARQRRSGRRIIVSTLLFSGLCIMPVLAWRLRFGGWLT